MIGHVRSKLLALSLILLICFGMAGPDSAVAQDDTGLYSTELYKAMTWRFIGPYRGGRVVTVTGVPSRPGTYYMGATGGGVWKSENSGHSWMNVSDGFFNTATIGAVAVAFEDPNVVYAGTGEAPIRGVTTSHGDGVYKSTDAGKTWQHVGLAETRQISKVRIHPRNPDLVYVAAQGNPWGPNPQRGVYRSEDGGESWELVLSVDENTGAADLAMDPTNPRILYAAMWDHRRRPWYVKSGGPGGGLHKSVDGGDTWEKLEGGLPETVGKVGVSVSASNPERVYAIVEAEEGGLYRSDDSGESWQRLNSTRVIQARSWYYNHVYADPVDDDTVYVMNVPLMKSIDGGKNFEAIRGIPHGDHHDLWIHPEDNRILINGNDGGATVSLDGGKTWSTLDNQPTAQFYRVNTDNRFPYYIYGGQQDNSTMAIASASSGAGIGRESWYPVGGGESAHIAFDPDDPKLVYATSINATIDEYDVETGVARSLRPYPEYVFGRDVKDQKYRTNWNAPVATSPHDPNVLYYGAHVLLRSTDRGRSWQEISGDLTRDEEDKQGKGGGPITNEQAGAEFYNTIFYVVESPHEAGTIWVGSDDGLVHLTRDGGGAWSNVTPKDVGEAHVNSIEVSPHDPAAAYIAVAGYKMNDFTPHVYKTVNYGKSWKKIIGGLPEDTFVRAVREDPERRGLLYAATETGIFVSFDDGNAWQSLQLDLPEVAVTDLQVRRNDLVAATQGRGFWVLDDLTPLHQLTDEVTPEKVHLFAPRDAYRVGGGGGFSRPNTGKNPPYGAVIQYVLPEDVGEDTVVMLEILDADADVVRTFRNEETDWDRCSRDNTEPRNRRPIKVLPAEPGMNRWVWNLQRDPLYCVPDVRLFRGWNSTRVVPGTFTARLTVGEVVKTQSFEVLEDPRRETASEDFAELDAFLGEVTALFNEMMRELEKARSLRSQAEDRMELAAGHERSAEVEEAGKMLVEKIDAWEEQVVQPRHETFDDDINHPNMLDVQVSFLLSVADSADVPLSDGAKQRLEDLQGQWDGLRRRLDSVVKQEGGRFNALLSELALPATYVGSD